MSDTILSGEGWTARCFPVEGGWLALLTSQYGGACLRFAAMPTIQQIEAQLTQIAAAAATIVDVEAEDGQTA